MVNFGKFTTKSGGGKIVYSVFAGFSVFSFGFLSALLVSPSIDIKTSTNAVTQTVGPHSLSMASDSAAEINITPTSEQAVYSATNNLTVSNTCSAGATITMNTSGPNNSLMRAASDDLIKSIPATTGTSLDNTSWGFSTNNGNTWGAVPSSTDTAATIYNGTDATTGTTVPVMFGTKIDSTLPSGTYTNDVVYTMTPNSGCLYYTVTWNLDGGTATGATYPTTLSWGETVDLSALTPTKDGYTFSGWSNGSDTFTGSETNTNINGNENLSLTMTAEWAADYVNYGYTGAMQAFTVTRTGYYKLEVWGAKGEDCRGQTGSYGGAGGYATGDVLLQQGNVLNVVVGNKGVEDVASYNGGGVATVSIGGGATHIALRDANGTYSTLASYGNASTANQYVYVVAGGGGGGGLVPGGPEKGYGGVGGGSSGTAGSQAQSTHGYIWAQRTGQPGTQSGGGAYGLCHYDNVRCGTSGSFGKGGDVYNCNSDQCNTGAQAGGGGGWYGGGSARHTGAGGGSGHIGNNVLNSSMIAGNAAMPKYDGDGTMTGNNSDGHARITYLGTSI